MTMPTITPVSDAITAHPVQEDNATIDAATIAWERDVYGDDMIDLGDTRYL